MVGRHSIASIWKTEWLKYMFTLPIVRILASKVMRLCNGYCAPDGYCGYTFHFLVVSVCESLSIGVYVYGPCPCAE